MATLEDAAEQLVVKLRGLDSEIEDSEQKLDELTKRVEGVARDVEKDWTALAEAAASLLDKVHAEQEELHRRQQEAAQGLADAVNRLGEDGAAARSEVGEGRAQLDGVAQHAQGLEPGVEALAADGGEAPAESLSERARELEEELARLVEETRDFLRDEVVAGVEEAGEQIREACESVRGLLADEMVDSLQQAFEEWESKVDGLEDYVMTQGYKASHRHAQAVVEYAIEECETGSRRHLDELQEMTGALVSELQELTAQVETSANSLVAKAGAELIAELDHTRASAAAGAAALDRVKQQLSSYSFVEV